MDIRSAAALGPRVQFSCADDGRTKQSMAEECDINIIMAKFERTGFVSHLAKHGGSYGFASAVDFHDAMNVVTKAEQMFADLPAKARRRFGGDASSFLEFVQDSENLDEMVELGLAEARSVADKEPEATPGAESRPEAPSAASEEPPAA